MNIDYRKIPNSGGGQAVPLTLGYPGAAAGKGRPLGCKSRGTLTQLGRRSAEDLKYYRR
jgi:hypothetical protein